MKSELLHIGPVTIYGYGLMIAIGILAAFFVAEKRAKQFGLSGDTVFSIGLWCMVGGILGAKLMYYIVELPAIIKDPSILLDFSDGFVVYGGIILGIATGYIYAKIKKCSFIKYFDLVMPSIALAQGFGRIGCFLAGCCYGRETDSFLGVTFHNPGYASYGVSVLPTQLFSSAANFIHFFILIYFAKRAKADGQVAGLYLILYSLGRFILEFFRGDPRGSVGPMSTSQFIAIFGLLAGIGVFLYCTKRYPKSSTEE